MSKKENKALRIIPRKETLKSKRKTLRRKSWDLLAKLIQKALLILPFLLLLYTLLVFLEHLVVFRLEKIFNLEDEKFESVRQRMTERDSLTKRWGEMKELIGKDKENICTGGVPASSLSPKEYTRAFAEGPCAPVVVVPGLTGCKLIAEIDCERLREADPDTFRHCGWNTCSGALSRIPYFFNKPRREYVGWVPFLTGPLAMTPYTKKSQKCFAGIMGSKFEIKDGRAKLLESPGVKVYAYGVSPQTRPRKVGHCGRKALNTLTPYGIDVHSADYLEKLLRSYEYLGYRVGLSFQPFPYKWHYHYTVGDSRQRLQNVIKIMHKMFNKKTLIAGHSLGNNLVAHLLWTMPQSMKDKMVARYIGFGVTLLGVTHTPYSYVAFDSSYRGKKFGLKWGFTQESKMKMLPYAGAFYALFPQRTLLYDADEPYMKAMVQRTEYENSGKPMPKGTVMEIFPDRDEVCFPYTTRRPTEKCHFNLTADPYIAEIAGKKYTAEDIPEMLERYSFSNDTKAIYEHYRDSRFTTLPNPGVQSNVVFSYIGSVQEYFSYSNDSSLRLRGKGVTEKPDFWKRKPGDTVVPTTSALIPFLKWADQFKNGQKDAHPVNFVEACSKFRRRDSIFLNNTKQGDERKITESAYFGVGCGCEGTPEKSTTGDCVKHAPMVTDSYVIKFLINSGIDYQKGYVSEEFASLPEEFFSGFYDECKLLNNIEGFGGNEETEGDE